ncbi:H/ACA ribonucleoprotein complex subunit 2 [Peziza echinospora]|nr:H/ACA ribonucleoprotein complex subunit 2 [Peziza echinospora]
MAKEKSSSVKPEKKEKKSEDGKIAKKEHKKDKKEKKEKLAAVLTGDVSDKLLKVIEEASAEKKEKKDKKSKKDKSEESEPVKDVEMERADIIVPVVEAKKEQIAVAEGGDILVPFATPLANEKVTKKALKTVKKGAKSKCLKRGVKEVVKAIRKAPASTSSAPHGLVILAADISPMDVISHIPVLCEDQNIPYIFVQSRAELGAAGGTKRPTSVVMIVPTLGKGKKSKDGKDGGKEKEKDDEALKESYEDLVKAVKSVS